MKLRIVDRVFAAIVAVCFLLAAAAIVAQWAFNVPVDHYAERLLTGDSIQWLVIRCVLIALCLIFVWRGFALAFRRKKGDGEYVDQRTDGGELRVSVKAIEGLVRKCVAKHEELDLQDVRLDHDRDGLIVHLRCNTAAEISIPLAVASMQKQLKEYILESTGLSVDEICVSVDDAEAALTGGSYKLHEAVADPEIHAAQLDHMKDAAAEESAADPSETQQEQVDGQPADLAAEDEPSAESVTEQTEVCTVSSEADEDEPAEDDEDLPELQDDDPELDERTLNPDVSDYADEPAEP